MEKSNELNAFSVAEREIFSDYPAQKPFTATKKAAKTIHDVTSNYTDGGERRKIKLLRTPGDHDGRISCVLSRYGWISCVMAVAVTSSHLHNLNLSFFFLENQFDYNLFTEFLEHTKLTAKIYSRILFLTTHQFIDSFLLESNVWN